MRHRRPVQSFMVCALTVISLCAAQTVFAQTTLINYRGNLEFDGVPANGNYDFQFRLFDAVSGGVQQGVDDEQLNITVTNGAYIVNLDFDSAVFSGADRFLEISVRPDGVGTYSAQSPRRQIMSTAYSIRSLVATTADGLSATCAGCVTSGHIQNVQGSQVTGSVAGSQISGTIPVASVPAGSFSYIQNTMNQHFGNFNITGNGTAGGTLQSSVVNATTQYNLGGNRVLSNAGASNLFAGTNAGVANTGSGNAFFGSEAGASNTTGFSNSFFGASAGASTTTGSSNAFFGRNAGTFNSTGSGNAFFGANAGQTNTTGVFNSFFGRSAGTQNTTGNGNSFFGQNAGFSNSSGDDNSFFGLQTGSSNTTGNRNSFFGRSAGIHNTTGYDNSFFGTFAGDFNTTSCCNSFFGARAGYSNTTGERNSSFGNDAGLSNTTGRRNSFFGNSAGAYNTTGEFNTFFGDVAGFFNSTGGRNTFVGMGADFITTTLSATGEKNTLLGYYARVNSGVNNSTAIGADAEATASNTIVLGTKLETVIVRGKLQVDLLGAGGSQQLCLNNSMRLASCSSSLRYKTDLRPFAGGLAIISRLQPVSFTWKDGGMRDLGFGAEDVEQIEPLLVTYNTQGLVEGVKYDRITVALVNALKEQQLQVTAQQTQIAELKSVQAENDKLKAQLGAILVRLEQIERAQAGKNRR